MARKNLREKIAERLFLLDGAMGTQLFARGAKAGKGTDYLNIELPDIVLDVHKAYFDAGCDAVITNTLGANRCALARHELADKAKKINIAAGQIARRAAGDERYVLGNIGPCGDFLAPLGTLKSEELHDAFAEQAKALLIGGVDGFIIETMTALDEIKIAMEAVKSVAADLPILASMSFGKAGSDYRTMMGVDIESFISEAVSQGIEAVGFNCGTISLDEYVELAEKMAVTAKALSSEIFVYAEPNAGKPELVDDHVEYNVSPEDFAIALERIYLAGITIIGGCCGTSPEHIKAVAKKLRNMG